MKKPTKEEVEKKVIADITERIKTSDEFLEPYRENWRRYYQMYRSFVDENKWPTHSKIFNPYIWSAIETQTSKAIAQKPNGEFVSIPELDEQGNIIKSEKDPDKIGKAFDKWWRESKMNFKTQSAFKKGMIYGTSASRIYWDFQMGWREGKRVKIKDAPNVDLLRLEDKMVGFDNSADSIDEIGWAYYKFYMTKTDIKNIEESPSSERYINLDKAVEAFDNNTFDNEVYKNERLESVGAQSVKDDTVKKVEAVYQEDYRTGKCSLLLGRKVLILDEPNPYKFERSLIWSINSLVPSEILGMSDVEPTERLQHGLNVIQNERRDNVQSVLKPMWLLGDDSGVDEDELVDELNGVVHASDINKLKQLIKPNVTQSAYQEEASIKNDIQQALSVTNASKGSEEVDASRSGVAIERLQSAADARVRTKLELFETLFVKEIAEKWASFMAQYQTEPIVIEENGETTVITQEDFQGNWKYFVESGSTKHTDPYQNKVSFTEYMKDLLDLASHKKAEEMQLAGAQQAQQQPQIDPQTGQPIPPPPAVASAIDYDKLAEELSEVYGQKNWRDYWKIAEEEMQESQPRQELLPSVEEEEPPMQQELLPSIEENQRPPEMLPDIEEEPRRKEQLPKLDDEMLPPV